jgi:Protein of unknown function with HXXEE motif
MNVANGVAGTSDAARSDAGQGGLIGRAVRWFMQLDFRKAIWLAPLAWALHEAEEWNINAFESRHFVDPGYFSAVDHTVLWIGLAWVALQGVLWTGLTAWPRNPRFAAFLALPWFIYLPFGNALQHVWYEFRFGGYTPGIVTATLLIIPVVLGLTVKAIRGRLIPWWYAAIFYLGAVTMLVSAIQSGNRLPPMLVRMIGNSVHTIRALLGRS